MTSKHVVSVAGTEWVASYSSRDNVRCELRERFANGDSGDENTIAAASGYGLSREEALRDAIADLHRWLASGRR